ncbi:MAG: TolC family protein [Oceanococcaceae bacterium]
MMKVPAHLSLVVLLLLPLATHAASLDQVMRKALRVDPRVPASLALSTGENARAALDRAPLLPQLSATADYGETKQKIDSNFFPSVDESFTDSSVALELRQSLFRWDMRSRWSRSDMREARVLADEILRREDFLLRVVDRYSAVLETQAGEAFARADLAALLEEQASIDDRLEAGRATITDQRDTQARRALAEAALLLAEDDRRNAEDALRELIGDPLPTLRALPETLPSFVAPVATLEAFIKTGRENAARVQVARLDLAIAESLITSAIAEAAPRVDLVGRLSTDDSSESLGGQQRDASRIGVQLNVPIYAGGAALKGLTAARADRDRAAAAYDLTQRQAEQEAYSAWRAVDSAQRRLTALAAAREAATLALEATRDGFDIGRRTQLDVLEAQSANLRAERDHTLARYALLRALARREAAVSDLHFNDFPRFDQLFAGNAVDTVALPESE